MSEYDHDEELKKFCIRKGIWNEKEEIPTKFVINKLKTITVKHPDGYSYLQNVQDGFTTKRPKQKKCQYCFEELTGRHRKFCSGRCNDLYTKIKNKRKELEAEGIMWNENKDREIPNQKEMIVTYRGENGELFTDYDDGITKKSGKPLVKDSKESKDFSKGKDY